MRHAFLLNQQTPGGRLIDPDGTELPDLEAARADAMASARQLWVAAIVAGIDLADRNCEITNGSGHHLLSVPFRAALSAALR